MKEAREKRMILKKIVVGAMSANCYVVGDAKTKEVFIIDPGGDHEKIIALVQKNGYKVKSVINTHGHADHISGNRFLNFPVWIHADDADFLKDPNKNLSYLVGSGLKLPAADKLLKEGDTLKAGSLSLEVIHTPGHTPGSICLKSDGMIFTGDTLFCAGVGRTDFPYGSEEKLTSSLKSKVLSLDGDMVVYPGHGPSTTIARERNTNPFIT
ncbi:MAG: MBL fold metallo-hydrolase [Candidatus Omnitrophota bacterium]